MPATITISKFIGTISLGLLTGASYTLSTVTLPSLLRLPTASNCSAALTHLTRLSTLQRRILVAVPLTVFPLAYILSPSHARHPYLLWTTLASAMAGFGPELPILLRKAKEVAHEEDDGVKVGRGDEEDVNGETVRSEVSSHKGREAVRTALAGSAFALAVIGIWGDGY